MEEITKLDKFLSTPFRQEIELQHVDHAAGFSTLRVRIREIKRFTVFDIDAATAEHWGKALLDWAATQKQGETK
jgi:O-methyltransferase involved in polyketide biosynthesis